MEEFRTINNIISFNTPISSSWADDLPTIITNSVRLASSTLLAFHNLALYNILLLLVYSIKLLWHFRSMISSGRLTTII
jgi:hypothetical protein